MTLGTKRNDHPPLVWTKENIKQFGACKADLAIRHFRFMLEGRKCQVYTDHKPLRFAFHQRRQKASERQARQLRHIFFIVSICYCNPIVFNYMPKILDRVLKKILLFVRNFQQHPNKFILCTIDCKSGFLAIRFLYQNLVVS